MTLIDTILTILSIFMISWNIYLIFRVKKLKSQIKDRKPSIELDEFLSDLYAGGALLRVNRIDQTNLLMRSPRGR